MGDLIIYENYDGTDATSGNEWYLPIDRVVKFTAVGHQLVLTELCDENFYAKLDKENAQKLVDSLQIIVDNL